ncbi:hypothetical protein L1887_17056 [Cichorium endivia]|nr:hypothetical protein L1887_17056 [Cichorium endivia]
MNMDAPLHPIHSQLTQTLSNSITSKIYHFSPTHYHQFFPAVLKKKIKFFLITLKAWKVTEIFVATGKEEILSIIQARIILPTRSSEKF